MGCRSAQTNRRRAHPCERDIHQRLRAGAPQGAVSVRRSARHKQVPLRPPGIAIHVDLAIQAVVDSEREDPRRAPEKIVRLALPEMLGGEQIK